MTVDCNIRALAACSVFEIRSGAGSKRLSFPLRGTSWVADHSRSFVLGLPGEEKSTIADAARTERLEKMYDLRAAIRRLNQLCSCAGRTGQDRVKAYHAIMHGTWADQTRQTRVDAVLNPALLTSLDARVASSDTVWRREVLKIHREWEHVLGVEISAWRRSTGRRLEHKKGVDRGKEFQLRGGVALNWIEELINIRKLLNAWSAHARLPGEVVRAQNVSGKRKDETTREVKTDEKLLEHINNLKDDYLKKGANIIIMAALGYCYDSEAHRWDAKHAPCHLILFEDLIRYRFSADRSRYENSKLMLWCHRALIDTVKMQGALYGIRIGIVAAGYTSRFHAKSGAPGVRARLVTEKLRSARWFRSAMELEGIDASMLRLRSIVPVPGGDLFVTLGPSDKPIVLQADINAAQNLHRRFWTRYNDPIRISCCLSKGQEYLIPKPIGVRLQRVLGEFFVFVPVIPGGHIYRLETVTRHVFEQLGGSCAVGDKVDDDTDDESIEVERLRAEADEAAAKIVTLFQDPSGVFFPRGQWVSSGHFWGVVKNRVCDKLGIVLQVNEEVPVQ